MPLSDLTFKDMANQCESLQIAEQQVMSNITSAQLFQEISASFTSQVVVAVAFKTKSPEIPHDINPQVAAIIEACWTNHLLLQLLLCLALLNFSIILTSFLYWLQVHTITF